MRLSNIFYNGVIKENPIFVQLIGMCATLAITTSALNGLSMGLSVTGVLVCSNFVISLLRNVIPDKVRIPAFVVVIATFVTMVDMFLKAFAPAIYSALGLFIPLIVVNCIIFARAETFASKNGVIESIVDGLGMGIGYTIALVILGSIREILGAGSIFGIPLFGEGFQPALILIMPPGAFILLGTLIGIFNLIRKKNENKKDVKHKEESYNI
ncbi:MULTISPECIES: electron transport complex subunit RsxE [Tissierellales]|uniref:Ion-translocating oxidoreductase complex subunit E n=1 Tax=Acidilutibacter cellobiosedens TaxID=2507161 RepID=A0A410QCU4_9FIRM|nr:MULTISPECIES: electron transport complex subunit E [Tissierellales]QAT61827.1 electron transport complex subunit E [Acidilutibacter cellobiosedens]SCL81987.1 Nitrogen fixation protein RnfE [Sporanaerobacter sp. PP17-6a]